MATSWVVEVMIDPDREKAFIEAIKRQWGQVYSPKVMPFDGGFDGVVPDLPKPVVYYGSLQGVKYARERGWTVFGDFDKFSCTYYYPRLRDVILNDRHVFLPYGCLQSDRDFLVDAFGVDDCVFVRPDKCTKSFTGQTVGRKTWRKDLDLVGFYDLPPEELVVVAPPKRIVREYRFVVGRKEILTGSMYRAGQTRCAIAPSHDVTVEARRLLRHCTRNGFDPAPIWMMDVCESEGEVKILEVGPFNCSGLYSCDPDEIAKEVDRILEISA